jgi:hypothetical protein
MQEPEQQESLGSYVDRSPMTLIRVGLASKARPGHGSDESWESELDHSGDDLRVCYPITANPIYNIAVLSESDSKGGREVFMVGRANVFANQTEEEIAQAIATEIARSESLTRNAEKAAGKRHTSSWDHNDNLTDSDEDGGDGAASGGTTPSSIVVAQPTARRWKDSEPKAELSGRNSTGAVSRCTACWPTTL